MNELVSIITPSFNTALFLYDTIRCVLAQTYTNWELLIVDDCSTDATDDVVALFEDARIRYFKNERNSGAAYSRNRALREARGRWIAFLDSDDLWTPDKLEKQICFMEKNGYAFSYTSYVEMNEQGKIMPVMWTGPKTIGRLRMHTFNYMGCLTVMYDRDAIGLLQIEDLKKRNDYALWIRASKKATAHLLPEVLALYRVRGSGSITDRGQSPLRLVKYHYALWRTGEKKNPISALFWTLINLVCGFLKKKIFRKPITHDARFDWLAAVPKRGRDALREACNAFSAEFGWRIIRDESGGKPAVAAEEGVFCFPRDWTEDQTYVQILKSVACGKNLLAEQTDHMERIVYSDEASC